MYQSPHQKKENNFVSKLTSQKLENPSSRFYTKVKRENERAICLNCKLPDGREWALGYSYIAGFRFNPSKGIEVKSTEATITIQGRNLYPLYKDLLRHKVRMIQSENEFLNENPSNEKDLFIARIEIEEE